MAAFTFNPADLQRLNRLMFLPRLSSVESESGSRRSRRSGDGGDFLDYRAYMPGDDLRKVDWNVYARVRQLFIRLNESPRQLSVTILVDTSRSMAFGSPDTKLQQAQKIACALGFIAMRGGDRVFVGAFGARITPGIGPVSGARGLASMVRFLSSLECGGESDLWAAAQQIRAMQRNRGIVIVLSDLLNVPKREESLLACTTGGGTLLAVQILDPVDHGEGLSGKVRLRDSETGQLVDVDLDRHGVNEYAAAVEADCRRLESFCSGARRHYIRISTRDNYLHAVCDALKAKAILR